MSDRATLTKRERDALHNIRHVLLEYGKRSVGTSVGLTPFQAAQYALADVQYIAGRLATLSTKNSADWGDCRNPNRTRSTPDREAVLDDLHLLDRVWRGKSVEVPDGYDPETNVRAELTRTWAIEDAAVAESDAASECFFHPGGEIDALIEADKRLRTALGKERPMTDLNTRLAAHTAIAEAEADALDALLVALAPYLHIVGKPLNEYLEARRAANSPSVTIALVEVARAAEVLATADTDGMTATENASQWTQLAAALSALDEALIAGIDSGGEGA